MKNIMIILKHNLKSIMKGWFWIILIFPLVINLFVSVFINKMDESSGGTNYKVAIYTKDDSSIIDRLLPEDKFSDRIIVKNKKELREVLDEKEASVGVIFNSNNIYKDIKSNKENTVEVLCEEDENNKNYVLNILNSSITQMSSLGNNREEYLKLYEKYENEKYEIKYEISKLADVFAYIIAFGMFSMAFLFIACRGMSPLLREKELKIDRRILVSKVSRVEYVLGHILGCFVLLLLQSITLVGTFYLFNRSFDVNFGWMILLSIALSFVGIAIALIILSISNNSTMYYTLVSIVITPMCLLSGGFVPTEFMPQMVQNFSLIFPLTWINSAFNKILMNGSNVSIGLDLIAAVSISIVLIMLYLVIEHNKKSKLNY
ncbi:MAG: ABC transporter permease [Bacilli bacterium]